MATQPKSRSSLRKSPINAITVGRILVPLLVLALWQLSSIALDILPGVISTSETIYQGFLQGDYLVGMIDTTITVLIGFVIAVTFGLLFGVALGTHDTAHDLFEPFILNTYAIPKIILFPIFLFVFQLGMEQKVAFGAFHGFFPMLILTMGAVREVPDIYLDVKDSLRLSQYQTFRYILFPSILVQLVVGLRLAFNLTFLGVILSELFAAKSGIGLQLSHAMADFNIEQIIAIVTVLGITAFIVNMICYASQRKLEKRWNLTTKEGL